MSNDELALWLLSEDHVDSEDVAKALDEAEARGRAAGLEEAWKLAHAEKEMRIRLSEDKYSPDETKDANRRRAYGAMDVADAIEALIQKSPLGSVLEKEPK